VRRVLARRNPWQDLFDLEREVSDTFRRVFGTSWVTQAPNGSVQTFRGGWSPAVDVLVREGDLVVRAELPGVDPERDVDIELQDGVLVIRGERHQDRRTEDESHVRTESVYGSFERSIRLPEGVKPDDITASYDNGILEVTVAKAAEMSAGKRIPITVGGHPKALDATTGGSQG
jgi:HSP20 family protein